MKHVLIFERALEGVYTIGPFDSADAATAYARKHHSFPQVWRVGELRTPQVEAAPAPTAAPAPAAKPEEKK